MSLETFNALLLFVIALLCVNRVFKLICMKPQIWDRSEFFRYRTLNVRRLLFEIEFQSRSNFADRSCSRVRQGRPRPAFCGEDVSCLEESF